jgi:hypothetical protein
MYSAGVLIGNQLLRPVLGALPSPSCVLGCGPLFFVVAARTRRETP